MKKTTPKPRPAKSDAQTVIAAALGDLLGRLINQYFPPTLPQPDLQPVSWREPPPPRPTPATPDPFRLLGLRRGCSAADVRRRVRQLAAIYHPDREMGDGDKMAEINAAADAILAELGGKH